nr:CocE/NonD family hydrolase [Candidatus Sigynarchaeota archaeon]
MDATSRERAAEPFDAKRISAKKPKYKGFTTTSYHVAAKDGVPIAVDVILPKGLPGSERVTAIMHMTRYWRAYNFKAPIKWFMRDPTDPVVARVFAEHGYALLNVDVRGTGASGGVISYPFDRDEDDAVDIMNWIITQPWSNGRVVTYGTSYSGSTAELVATTKHPALKAVICKQNPWDMFAMIVPGGIINKKFIDFWSNLGRGLDQTTGKALLALKPINPAFATLVSNVVIGVKPVDLGRSLLSLRDAARIHEKNAYPSDYESRVTFSDDPINDEGVTADQISIFSRKDEIEATGVPMYAFGSWQDSVTADVVISRFLHFKNPQKAVIGDWDHVRLHKASPFFSHAAKPNVNHVDQTKDWLLFYDDVIAGSFPDEKMLYYYTMGEERWKKTATWPPAGTRNEPWYFQEGSGLGKDAPAGEHYSDECVIRHDTGTGIRNRWYTLLSLPIKYPHRAQEDQKLLVYTSEPITAPMEITGHPILTIFVKTTRDDGMIVAYLEFIDPKGGIHMITEGQIRLMHRKVSTAAPPYPLPIPYHSYKRKDALPVVPGELMEVTVALYPTSILLGKGSRLRIAIGGADKDSFSRCPAEGTTTLTVERDIEHPSRVILPIMDGKGN